jgi:hypothetical protein
MMASGFIVRRTAGCRRDARMSDVDRSDDLEPEVHLESAADPELPEVPEDASPDPESPEAESREPEL